MTTCKTLFILSLACLAAACVGTPMPGSRSTLARDHEGLSGGKRIEQSEVIDHASIQRRQRNSNMDERRYISCFSQNRTDSFPAAHIVGKRSKWANISHTLWTNSVPTNPDAADFHGYKSYWSCTEGGAYVDGGMYFNQTNKKLHVPKCGYYHVSSQMYYVLGQPSSPSNTRDFVNHRLLVKPNCEDSETEREIKLESMSSLSVGDRDKSSRTSTYTAGVFHLCEGAQIYTYVPTQTPCCPYGEEVTTFLAAHLVRETTCTHPRKRMLCQNTKPTHEDYEQLYNGTLSSCNQ